PLVPIVENKNMPHSIEKRQTKRTQNNKRKIKLDLNLHIKDNENTSPSQRRRIENSALEELFKEQNISWNRKEFVKECQSQNIRLDDMILLIQLS
ncbi:25775_t:CDS:2, partial [Gigaspora rosea]